MATSPSLVYRTTPFLWMLIGIAVVLAVVSGFDALAEMVRRWETSEEYGYGYMIPVITLFLIWQRKDRLESIRYTGSYIGVVVLAAGVSIALIGQLSAIYTITQYGFVIALIGGLYALMGWAAFKIVLVPMLLLFLMIPLPAFVFNNLSSQLQLISSQIGVAVIRLFDISVNLEGNVIDLGTYKLQVVEACSGLNYLFPLIALSIIASYFYQADLWKRLVVIFSSIPITVLMNSFRIGVIGVLVEYHGIEQAEGFLHDFEGWIVFMACVALLIVEMWILSRFGKDRRPFREIFGMDFPETPPEEVPTATRAIPRSAFVALMFLSLGAAGATALGERVEHVPERAEFVSFPMSLGEWRGRNDALDSLVIDVLKLDDYILADYKTSNGQIVNLYAAYYSSQRSGASAHSPASCLPGGGWRIMERGIVSLDDGSHANRFIIRKGEHRQLVYYWFKQRDRIIASEFMVKWYMLWDALTRNRTDGALVRLTTLLKPGEDAETGDMRLRAFAREASTPLNHYIPD
jgi:exosortase D (VPLPA-CTERM-specific)